MLRRHFPGHDPEAPETAELHRGLIRSKPLLRAWYEEQYRKYLALVGPDRSGRHVELGSGGGFLKERFPQVTTSSVRPEDLQRGLVDRVLDAHALDLPEGSVDSFFLLDVLHHLQEPERLFAGLERCLKPGGFAFIVDPANTLLSRLVYKNLHHEGFDERSPRWGHEGAGTLAYSNQAMGWIVFERDRARFEREFPRLAVESLRKHTFLSYLLSGGLSYEEFLPGFLRGTVPLIEAAARPFMGLLGHHMDVVLRKR